MKASEIIEALRGTGLIENCQTIVVNHMGMTGDIRGVRWNNETCQFEVQIGPLEGPIMPPQEQP